MRPFVTKFLSDSRYSCYLVDVVVCGRIWLHLLCTDDQCRGSGPVCQSGSDLHHRAHPQSVDPHGGQQATHATGQTHSMICANSVSLGNFVTPLRALPWSDHISSYPLSAPSVGLHLLLLPSLYFYHLFLFDSSPIPLQHWAVCCVCVHTQAEAPIPASPGGPSLCLVLSPSIDFESKARRVELTHSPPHTGAILPAPLSQSWIRWTLEWCEVEKGKQRIWMYWWEHSGKSDKSLSHLDVKRGKTVEQNMKALKSTLSIHIPLRD